MPLLGLAAAFLFAAQMVNFPVAGGTSGHLVGGVLVAALLGPSAAVVVLTTVLIVQCFLFADGGVLALGANVFNMAMVGAVGGYAIYRGCAACLPGVAGRWRRWRLRGGVRRCWRRSVARASLPGRARWPWPVAFTAMTGVHMLIGWARA